MPKRSDILCYKMGDCFEVILDISDAPDARFQSATFSRGGADADWPLIEIDKMKRGEYRSAPNLLILHLSPRLPDDQEDDLTLPVDQIVGQLTVSLTYYDSNSGSTLASDTKFRVIPCSVSACDSCEASELLAGQS